MLLGATLAWLASAGLALATYRNGPLLTFDAYYYCEFAKQFAETWPDRFGNHWPFGYPLAGALLVRAGLPAFEALVLISSFSLFALGALATEILREHPLRRLVPVALVSAPIVSVQHLGALTELPFAACLLGLGFSLAHWQRRGAIWAAGGCAVAALATRYAGVIAFAALACWLVWSWQQLRHTGRLRTAITAFTVASTVGAGLLLSNFLRSGHLSGASREGAPGLSALPRELVDFGWSIPSALLSGGLRDRIGMDTALGLVIGSVCCAVLGVVSAASWLRPRSAYSRPLALIAFGYSTGMAVLHCVGSFDPLYNARTFLPALVPFGLLIAEWLAGQRRVLIALCLLLGAAGVANAIRGISREIGGDVRAALPHLRPRLHAGDTIAINNEAFAVSAYLRPQTTRVWADTWREDHPSRFTVIAAKPTSRAGGGVVSTAWRDRAMEAERKGTHRLLLETPELLVLEKTSPR